jgi:hypothetical protein
MNKTSKPNFIQTTKSTVQNFIKSIKKVLVDIPANNQIAFLGLVFLYVIVWFFNLGEYKTYTYNYSICFSLAAIITCLSSFFYCFNQITKDAKTQNWFSVGVDLFFNLAILLLTIQGTRELTQRSNPFNSAMFIFFTYIIFFAQIYINKSYRLFKSFIIAGAIFALVAGIFRFLEIYTPTDYLLLIWAIGSYVILISTIILFFQTIKQTLSSLR